MGGWLVLICMGEFEQKPFGSPFAENRSAFFWINWLISSSPVSGNTWPRLASKACSMRRIGHSLRCHLNTFWPKSIMPWPSCKASSPSTILHGRSPKTVTRIGFATLWILISVDLWRPKMRLRRLATLERQPVACGDEHDPPVCEICLVVGAYRRLPCPPMPQWTGHQPVNRLLVDLTPHLRLLSVSRTALAHSWHMWPTRPHPKQQGFPSGFQPAPGSCTVCGGCSGPLSGNPGLVAGAAVVRGGLAWASNFATFVWSRSWLCKSFFSRVAVVWSSRATTGRSDAGFMGATSIGSSCRLNRAYMRLSWHCSQPGWWRPLPAW